MTDPAPLTPEQDAVRRLLADARHDGTTPPDVVARLDEALASLVAERGDAPLAAADPDDSRAPVVDLGARRRRTAGIGLLAAAAVVVAGVAVGQVLPRLSGSDDAGSTAGGDMATSDRELSDDSGGSDAGSGAAESQEMAPQTKQDASAVPTLSTADADLAQELRSLETSAGARRSTLVTGEPDAFCMSGIGPGRRLAAEVDGQPGVVVYKPQTGDAQEVAIYVCGNGEPVRTLFLPLP
jgi:hypothetical protein